MVRMSDTGVPLTMLKEQFRMHPDIASTVSTQFYSNLLRNAPSVFVAEEYIEHHARCIITTGATALSPQLRRFEPH